MPTPTLNVSTIYTTAGRLAEILHLQGARAFSNGFADVNVAVSEDTRVAVVENGDVIELESTPADRVRIAVLTTYDVRCVRLAIYGGRGR